MKRFLTILFIAALGSLSVLHAQTVKVSPIEKLTYMGYYNLGFIWIKAGKVEFIQHPSEKYPNSQFVMATGETLPTWDNFFRLRDTLYSHFDNETCLPYEFSRKAHEGSYNKTFDYFFDYKDSTIYGHINRIGAWTRKDTIKMVPDLYDMISVAWLSRGIDFSVYNKGDKIPIKILLDSEINELYIRYLGKDKIKLANEKIECHIFAPLLVAGEVFTGGENMKIWVSADEKRIPILVESKIIVGSVKGVLVPQKSKY